MSSNKTHYPTLRLSTVELTQFLQFRRGSQPQHSAQHQTDDDWYQSTTEMPHSKLQNYLEQAIIPYLPSDMLTFLTYNSILEYLHPALCDAVTERQNSQQLLQRLEQGQIFLVALPRRENWYQYHGLMRDILHSRLQQDQPEIISQLHQRASHWYEQHGMILDAIKHALCGQDEQRAQGMLHRSLNNLYSQNEERRQQEPTGKRDGETDYPTCLSQREVEVLRLVAQGASNAEIADHMIIATGTVKRHISNIFTKLLVSSRTQAVARAQALGLL